MSEHLFMLSLSFTLCRYFVLVVVTCCVIAVGIVCGSYLYSRFLTFIISKMLDKCVIHAAVHFNDNMTLKWFVCTPSVRVEQLFWISLCEDPFCWNCFEVESVDCFIAVVLHPYTWKLPKHFLYLSTRCMYNLDNITMMGLCATSFRITFHVMLQNAGRGDRGLENPPPGTIVDHTITRRNWYDFFLVSQHVRQVWGFADVKLNY